MATLSSKVHVLEPGDTGVKGDKGDTGIQGIRGDTGTAGAKGDTGTKGDTGVHGDSGIQGITGDTGIQGTHGDTGTKGDTGVLGAKGDTGVKGDTGNTGAKGDTGTHGDTGVSVTGDTGVQGIKGDTGYKGDTGTKGDTGPVYAIPFTWYAPVVGYQSAPPGSPANGARYFVKTTGTAAWAGHNEDIAEYVTDHWIFFDTAEGDACVNNADDLVYTFNGTSWVAVGTPVQGDTGTHGDTGVKGDTGAASTVKGDTGIQGTHGDTGVAGVNGDTGVAGAKGDTGTAGAKGDTGTHGDTGVAGSQGDTGVGGFLYTTQAVALTPAVKGWRYMCNTTSGPFTITLPAAPNEGDTISFYDSYGTFGANNLTIARNGKKIDGLAEDLVLDVNSIGVDLVFSASTANGWILNISQNLLP